MDNLTRSLRSHQQQSFIWAYYKWVLWWRRGLVDHIFVKLYIQVGCKVARWYSNKSMYEPVKFLQPLVPSHTCDNGISQTSKCRALLKSFGDAVWCLFLDKPGSSITMYCVLQSLE